MDGEHLTVGSRTSLEVRPKWIQRPASPADSLRTSTNAATSPRRPTGRPSRGGYSARSWDGRELDGDGVAREAQPGPRGRGEALCDNARHREAQHAGRAGAGRDRLQQRPCRVACGRGQRRLVGGRVPVLTRAPFCSAGLIAAVVVAACGRNPTVVDYDESGVASSERRTSATFRNRRSGCSGTSTNPQRR
ncbi:MAG: hypothetical protein QOJ46_1651 [bacterium]